MPAYWPGGVRHEGDASLICGVRAEREKARPDTVLPAGLGVGERERPERLEPQGAEYRRCGALADWLVVAVKPL